MTPDMFKSALREAFDEGWSGGLTEGECRRSGDRDADFDSIITYPQDAIRDVLDALATPTSSPLDDWHEDDGPVVWWKFPINEAGWIGTPLCSDWPGYHTHWTPHPAIPTLSKDTP